MTQETITPVTGARAEQWRAWRQQREQDLMDSVARANPLQDRDVLAVTRPNHNPLNHAA